MMDPSQFFAVVYILGAIFIIEIVAVGVLCSMLNSVREIMYFTLNMQRHGLRFEAKYTTTHNARPPT